MKTKQALAMYEPPNSIDVQFKRRRALLLGGLSLMLPLPTIGQTAYPTKPIRYIMPFPPGIAFDVMLRYLLQRVSEEIGQPIVVENVPGANGLLGQRKLASSQADGYTLGHMSVGVVASMSLYKNPGYDVLTSFEHICELGFVPWALIASPQLAVSNIAELVQLVQRSPGKYNTAWYTNSSRYVVHLFRRFAKLDVVEVPFKATQQIITEVRGGRVDFAFVTPDFALAQAAAGTVKFLAVSTASRLPNAPNVPTLSEQFPGFVVDSWVGIAAPAGTPKPIITKLEDVFARLLVKPEIQEKVRQFGYEPKFTPGEKLPARIREELPMWAAFVKEAAIQPE